MALKTANGMIAGTRQQFQLPIAVWDDGGATLDYAAALAAAVTAAPSTILSCKRASDDEITIADHSRSAITFQFTYKWPAQNTLLRRANIATKSKKLYHFLTSGEVYGVAGASLTSTNGYLKYKIDRQSSADEFNAGKPITVDPLAESRALDYATTADFVTAEYLTMMESLVLRGCFNDDEFLDCDTNTLQIVRFAATERDDDDWELSYGFGHQEPQMNVGVGDGVEIPTLKACDHYWLVEKEVYEDGTIQPKVIKVVVGRAWPSASFAVLALPGQ